MLTLLLTLTLCGQYAQPSVPTLRLTRPPTEVDRQLSDLYTERTRYEGQYGRSPEPLPPAQVASWERQVELTRATNYRVTTADKANIYGETLAERYERELLVTIKHREYLERSRQNYNLGLLPRQVYLQHLLTAAALGGADPLTTNAILEAYLGQHPEKPEPTPKRIVPQPMAPPPPVPQLP